MAETKISCPHCGRVGSTTKQIPRGATVRCPGCREPFRFDDSSAPSVGSGPASVIEPSAKVDTRRKLRNVLAVGVVSGVLTSSIVIGAVWLVASGASRSSAPTNPTDSVKAPLPKIATLTTEEVASKSEQSIGFIFGPSSFGTGFLVADGLLVTNAHVITPTPPDQLQVTFPAAVELDRGPLKAEVVYFDIVRDLAILKVGSRLPPLPIVPDHTFRRGQDVVVIGNPGLSDGRSLQCVVSRGVLGSEVIEDGRPFYQLSGSVNPGNSGGPALDLTGRVVGIVSLKASKQEGIGFCIPAPDLDAAIEAVRTQTDQQKDYAAATHVAAVILHRRRMLEVESDSKLRAFIDRTQPPTWLAYMDVGHELDDSAPESRAIAHDLAQANQFYIESIPEMVQIVLKTTTDAHKEGVPVKAGQLLGAAINYAPRDYFLAKGPFRFSDFAERYMNVFRQYRDHGRTMSVIEIAYSPSPALSNYSAARATSRPQVKMPGQTSTRSRNR